MKGLEILTVKKAVYSWSIRFREAVLDNERLLFLSEEYLEDLRDEHVSPNEFAFAAKEVRKRCRFFPQMFDLLKAVEEYRENPPASSLAQLPEYCGGQVPLTDEQQAINLKRLNILGRIACGDITHEQGAIEMEEL